MPMKKMLVFLGLYSTSSHTKIEGKKDGVFGGFQIGSTEWVKQNLANLGSMAVACLNVDCAVQVPGFFVGATPQLDDILVEVTKKLEMVATAKTFVGTDILDGKAVNVVDGMKMYEELFDDFGVRKMVSLVNDLRAAGRRGQFQGKL
ncbi:hypothetical protein L6452_07977 [Arctium lappa]|uniref:Uncharacterized protein n=1 Tax=Arctium lappa TaxID=4217 RepID=A0ACB9DGA2_ARCLA|nr:hypothetical protein L6452_07977 [Arctium lappa]